MSTYLLTYPLITSYTKIFAILLPVLALLVAIGLVTAFNQAGSLSEKLQAFLQIVIVVTLTANFDGAVQSAKKCIANVVEQQLEAKPELVPLKFVTKILAPEANKAGGGFWSFVSKLGKTMFHAVLVALICTASLVALSFMFLAYLAQELALEVGIALSPLFLGFLLLSSTRAIGVQFLLHMVALVLMPLGWGVASLVSDNLINAVAASKPDDFSSVTSSLTFATREFFSAVLLSAWILLSTIVTPFAMMKMVTTGASLGASAVASAKSGIKGFLPI